MILIKEVKSKKEAKIFTEFPNKMYKKIEAFVPALSLDEINVFNPKKNPTHKYVTAIRFLAYKDNKVVGRIAGLVNHKINYQTNVKQVRFTRLDMIDDLEVTKALINAVEAWGRDVYGMKEIIGPIGFTDMDRQGLLIEGFEHLNMFITIYNFPYYKDHLESLGFAKDVDWLEKRINWPTEVPEKLAKTTEMIKKRYGYRLYKPTKMKDLDLFIDDIFKVYNDAFIDLYGFLPLPDDVIDFYVKQVKSIIQLDWIWVVYDKEDKVAGFGLVMPSLALANKKSNGKLLPFGIFRILKALKTTDTIDFYFIAVDPKHQGRGVHALIFEDGIKTGLKHNIKYAETGPELEANLNIQAVWNGFSYLEHKRRRCFIKEIKETE